MYPWLVPFLTFFCHLLFTPSLLLHLCINFTLSLVLVNFSWFFFLKPSFHFTIIFTFLTTKFFKQDKLTHAYLPSYVLWITNTMRARWPTYMLLVLVQWKTNTTQACQHSFTKAQTHYSNWVPFYII